MSTALLVLETVLLALLALFVVALLRSHAEILRRLAAIERRDPQGRSVPAPVSAGAERAHDIAGQTLTGEAVKVGLGPGSPTTLLAFLTSGCAACGPLWESLGQGVPVPAGARLVVVAKGPEQESATALRELAPAGRELLMSTQAWRDYEVPASPHFVLVDGDSGWIAGRGTAGSWERIVTMVEQAVADTERADTERAETERADTERAEAGAPGPSASPLPPGASRAAANPSGSAQGDPPALVHVRPARTRTTSERAERAELALATAGIGPGHPSLYPADGVDAVEAATNGGERP